MTKKPKRSATKSPRKSSRKSKSETRENQATATIAANESVSDVVALIAGQSALRIVMPDAWDKAVLTFLVADDDETFHPLYTETGSELRVTVMPATTVAVPLEMRDSVQTFKVMSGSRENPIKQTAERTLTFIVR